MIKPSDKTVRGVLDENVRYVVPRYQRNFEWRREQAEEFFDDISSGTVFLGTLVFDISNKNSNKEILIVDGQQRMTTIFIFLAACRQRAKQIDSVKQVAAIQNKLSFIDDTSGDSSVSKLQPSPSIVEVFSQTIVNDKWDGKTFAFQNKKRQVAKIKPLFSFFSEKLSKLGKNEIALLLEKLYSSTFVVIEIEDPQEAFDIFERTNARGMELNAADLLKNYLFANNASEDMDSNWELIVENSSGNILRMIKYYYVSNYGYTPKKRLFKDLKKHGQDISAEILLKDVLEFSTIYSLINNGTSDSIIEWGMENKLDELRHEYNAQAVNRSFDALTLFGVTQTYPLVVKVMRAIIAVKNQKTRATLTKKFISFLKTIENFHFINSAVSQRPGNEVEMYYADKCEMKLSQGNIADFMATISKELKDKKVDVKEFVSRFKEINYENDFRLIYYIYDRMNNVGRRSGQYISIYNSDAKILRKNYNIDHLVAQNDVAYDFNKEDIEDLIHNIGNLLIISYHTNSGLNDKKITEKFDVLSEIDGANLPEAKTFVKNWANKKWNTLEQVKENILARSEEIAVRAYNDVWI